VTDPRYSAKKELVRHISSDGLLTFIVAVDEADDVTLGFEGYPWHTHADVLAALSGTAPEVAVEQFVAALLGNEAVIAISTLAGRIEDVWISDDPSKADPHKPDNEVIALRFWNGRPWQASP